MITPIFSNKLLENSSPENVAPVFINNIKIGGTNNSPNRNKTLESIHRNLFISMTQEFDEVTIKEIESFEKENCVKIPPDLKTFMSWKNIAELICNIFPLNNHLLVPGNLYYETQIKWKLIIPKQFETKYLIKIMNNDSGCCFWYAGFDDKSDFCKIYASCDDSDASTISQIWLNGINLIDFFSGYTVDGKTWHKTNNLNNLNNLTNCNEVNCENIILLDPLDQYGSKESKYLLKIII